MSRSSTVKRQQHNEGLRKDHEANLVQADSAMDSAFDNWLADMAAQEEIEPELPLPMPAVRVHAPSNENQHNELKRQLDAESHVEVAKTVQRIHKQQQALPVDHHPLFPSSLHKDQDDYESEAVRVMAEEEGVQQQDIRVYRPQSTPRPRRKIVLAASIAQAIQRLAHMIKARFSPQDRYYLKEFGKSLFRSGVEFTHDPGARLGVLVPHQTPQRHVDRPLRDSRK